MCRKIFAFLVIAVFVSQFLSAQLGVNVQKKPAVEKPKPVDFYQMLESKEPSKRRSAVDTLIPLLSDENLDLRLMSAQAQVKSAIQKPHL